MAKKSCQILEIEKTYFFRFPDNKMDSVPLLDIIKKIEPILNEFRPTIVFTHHGGDLNVDHRRTYQAVLTAARPIPGSSVKEIYSFEVLSSTEWAPRSPNNAFCPNVFFDVGAYFETKIEALRIYDKEMREFPHSRSYEHVKALAMLEVILG